MSDNNVKQHNENQEKLFADTNISMKSGRLVKDAELVAEGRYVKFRIGTNKQYEQDGEVKNLVNYFNVLVSHNLEEAFNIAKELKKGDWVYVKGEDSSKSVDTPEGHKETSVTTFAWKVVKKSTSEETNPVPA
ncbi:MAG: single-stranded DNA-binding protein [Balneolaceae bacterium]